MGVGVGMGMSMSIGMGMGMSMGMCMSVGMHVAMAMAMVMAMGVNMCMGMRMCMHTSMSMSMGMGMGMGMGMNMGMSMGMRMGVGMGMRIGMSAGMDKRMGEGMGHRARVWLAVGRLPLARRTSTASIHTPKTNTKLFAKLYSNRSTLRPHLLKFGSLNSLQMLHIDRDTGQDPGRQARIVLGWQSGSLAGWVNLKVSSVDQSPPTRWKAHVSSSQHVSNG